MPDLETRLGAVRDALAAGRHPSPSDEGAARAIAAGRRRRGRRLQAASIAAAALVAAGVTTTTVALRSESGTTVAARPDPSPAQLTGTISTVAPTEPEAPSATTTPAAPRATSRPATPTTAAPATSAPPTTVPEGDPVKVGVTTGVWVVGLDGTKLRLVSRSALGQIAWSPDADRLAVTDGDWIWRLPVDDARPATTIRTEDGARCLDWSSKGELAWVSMAGEVFVASDAAERGEVVATGHGAGDWAVYVDCRWSPDGTLLAVVDPGGLTLLERDGTEVQRVPGILADWQDEALLEWAPDGRSIAAVRSIRPTSPPYTQSEELVVVEPGADPVVVVGASEVKHLSWHPKSTGIYVTVQRDSDRSQQLVDVATKRAEVVAACCANLDALADGRFVGFSSHPEYGPRKVLSLVGADLTRSSELAFGRAPGPGAVMTECRGTYLWTKRMSPDQSRVAFVARASYGPRCDSPVF